MEKLLCDLASVRDRNHTSIVCMDVLGALGTQLASDINVTVLPPSKGTLGKLWQVYREVRRQKPDVIHCHNMQAHFFGSIAARAFKAEVVLSKHGQYIRTKGVVARLNKRFLRHSRVVGVSLDIVDIMNKHIPPGGYPAEYIPNGISFRPFDQTATKEEFKQKFGCSGEEIIVGMIARLARPKDHLILLESASSLLEDFPALKVLIVGEGDQRAVIEGFIASHGLEDHIWLLGERNDIPAVLNALDVFALTSSSEGIPMTILEAMAARLPVVATAVGGIPNVVKDGETGFLVPDKDLDELTEALRSLLESKLLRGKFGETGRRAVEDRFSIETIKDRYEAIYDSATGATSAYAQ